MAYAPVAENLAAAIKEYTADDQASKPLGRNVDEAVDVAKDLITVLGSMLHGIDWRAALNGAGPRSYFMAANSVVDHLRDPHNPGNQVGDGEETLGQRYRKLSSQLLRVWAICGNNEALAPLAGDAAFFEEVRVYMAKFDAEARRAQGLAVSEDIRRVLAHLMAAAVESGELLDIYAAAGMPKPTLSDLNADFMAKALEAKNPNLAIEALRALITEESAKAVKHNVVRLKAFSDRLQDLMVKYTNSQLTSSEVIAALVEVAHEVSIEADRGAQFSPPLTSDELAFYDAVATNESAVAQQGKGVLADIARDLVGVMRRDTRTDWRDREDVKAKLRSQIKRLLTKRGYPPDKQPDAIKLVIEQMEAIAPAMAGA